MNAARNMRSSNLLLLLTSLLSALMAIIVLADEVLWSYSGDDGPAYWAELSPDFALCSEGSAQSPVNIQDASALDLVSIEFHYDDSARDQEAEHSIYNNSHTIQVNVAAGSYIIYNGIDYDLLQFHFHSPSEHTIDGERALMEIHFVHRDPNSGSLAVVGVMLTEGEADNEAYAAIFDHLPAEVGDPEALPKPVALESLLPESRAYFTYQGSLTTPPCSETVRWLLLDTPVALSLEQIDAFRAIFDGNARPTQPLGKRDLLLDSG